MIKQTRGAIKFLLADYRAVLKYAMMAAAGIALSSPSYATYTTVSDQAGEHYSSAKAFDDSINIISRLKLENGEYSADSVCVFPYLDAVQYPDFVPELALNGATLTTSSAGKDSTGNYIDTIFVQGKLSLTDATINPIENGEKAGIQLWSERADAAFSGDVNINGDLEIGTRTGDLNIVLDGKDSSGNFDDLNLNITGEIGIDYASLTLKGYDKADNGLDRNTYTKVIADEVTLGHDAKLTVGHNASMEFKGLYIENYSNKPVQQGALTVTDGGKLAVILGCT